MAVDDHGLEVLKKSGEEVVPGNRGDYYIKVKTIAGSETSISDAVAANPNVQSISLPLANTEYAVALPANCKEFFFRARKICKLKLRYATGGDFISIGLGGSWKDSQFYSAQSIFLESDTALTVVELLTFT